MKTDYKFIRFVESKEEPGTWVMENRKSGGRLGLLGYYPRWKQYTVWFEPTAVFNDQCLRDTADFLDQLNKLKP